MMRRVGQGRLELPHGVSVWIIAKLAEMHILSEQEVDDALFECQRAIAGQTFDLAEFRQRFEELVERRRLSTG